MVELLHESPELRRLWEHELRSNRLSYVVERCKAEESKIFIAWMAMRPLTLWFDRRVKVYYERLSRE